MEYKNIKFEVQDNIGFLTFNRPASLNALNSEVLKELNKILVEAEKDASIKALIITGEGKAFVAGADISEMSDMDSEKGTSFSVLGQQTFNLLSHLKMPVIAAINGFALGGGCELAMACDIRIASTNAKFGQPEVNLGLIPGYAGTVRLPRLVGLANALYLLMTGEMIDANEAYRIGLVQKVVEPDKLIEEAKAIAAKIISKGPIAVQKVKEVTLKGVDLSFDEACRLESIEFGKLFDNKESHEGMKAFLEKRKPNW